MSAGTQTWPTAAIDSQGPYLAAAFSPWFQLQHSRHDYPAYPTAHLHTQQVYHGGLWGWPPGGGGGGWEGNYDHITMYARRTTVLLCPHQFCCLVSSPKAALWNPLLIGAVNLDFNHPASMLQHMLQRPCLDVTSSHESGSIFFNSNSPAVSMCIAAWVPKAYLHPSPVLLSSSSHAES